MSGGWTKQIVLGNGDVMVSRPKSSCKAAKGSRYNSLPVKEMKHNDPLLSTEILNSIRAQLRQMQKSHPDIFRAVPGGKRPMQFEDLINTHAGKKLALEIFRLCCESREPSGSYDKETGKILTVGKCWGELEYSAFGKEMQRLWKAIVNNQFYGPPAANPQNLQKTKENNKSGHDSRAEGTRVVMAAVRD